MAREIGVGEALLGPWVAQERACTDHPPGVVDADERAELAVGGRWFRHGGGPSQFDLKAFSGRCVSFAGREVAP